MLVSGPQGIALRKTPRTHSSLENFMSTFLNLITATKEGQSTIHDSVAPGSYVSLESAGLRCDWQGVALDYGQL